MTGEKVAGGEIRPCLIGGFRDKVVMTGLAGLLPEHSSGVPRYNPYVAADGSVCSLDMVRFRLKFSGNDDSVARFEDRLQRLNCLCEQYSMTRMKPGRYAHLYTFDCGESTVTVGVGQFVKGVKADMHRGFVEFNPNKVAYSPDFWAVVDALRRGVERVFPVRFDFAVDVPIARGRVRTRKDRRRYEFIQGAVLTEYLGTKNAPGYVKVYDKAAELGVGGMDLTRIEVTCSGDDDLGKLQDRWPVVYAVKSLDLDTTDVNAVVAMMSAQLVDAGDSPEKYLSSLDYRRRTKIRKLMELAVSSCPEIGASHVFFEVMRWAATIGATDATLAA